MAIEDSIMGKSTGSRTVLRTAYWPMHILDMERTAFPADITICEEKYTENYLGLVRQLGGIHTLWHAVACKFN